MTEQGKKVTQVNLVANSGLFLAKIGVGLFLFSLVIIADAINSLTDIFAAIAVLLSVREAAKEPDSDHPFGHHRAEPLAALVVAVFIGIVGFEIIKLGFFELLDPSEHSFDPLGVGVLLGSMAVKSQMYRYFNKVGSELKSPAIKAITVDSRNDILTSSVALFGFVGAGLGLPMLEGFTALLIGVWIIYSAVDLLNENLKFLLGGTPDKRALKRIRKRARSVRSILDVHDIMAHYVGNTVHVELHISLDREMSFQQAHDIAHEVKRRVEKLDCVSRAFIHTDPRQLEPARQSDETSGS